MSNGGSGRSVTGKQVGVGVLILLVIVFAIANFEDAEVSFVFHTFTVPLVVVIVGSALVGWLIGWFMGRNRNS